MRNHDDAPARSEARFAYLRGRLEAQAELAKAIGVLSIELAERMGSIFSGTETLWEPLGIPHRLPNLRSPATGPSPQKRALALDDGTRAQGTRDRVTKPHDSTSYWAKLTKEERAAEMAKRFAKRENLTPAQRAALKTLRKNARGAKPPKPNAAVQRAKQKIYRDRALAKQRGEELPPLPSAQPAA